MPQKSNPELVRNLTPYFTKRGEVLPVIDVTSLQIGAKGDGSTDDTAAIQKALTACNLLGGGVVYLPPYRTYIISSAGVGAVDGLRVYANTVLMGGGWSTILKMGNSADLDQIIYGSSVSGVVISDLQLDGNDGNQSSMESRGIRLLDCTYSLIDNVYVHDVMGTGATSAGIYIVGTSDYDAHIKITRCRSTGNTRNGIVVNAARLVEISSCIASSNSTNGIRVDSTDGGFTITNSEVILNANHGIRIAGTTRLTGGIVSNNIVQANGTAASNTYSGVRIVDCYDLVVVGNSCIDYGLGANTQKYGIEESGTCDYNLYATNNLSGNVTGAISESGANNKTAHNIGSATHDT